MQHSAQGLSRLDATPREVFFNRRQLLAGAALGVTALSWTGRRALAAGEPKLLEPPFERPRVFPAKRDPDYGLPASLPRRDATPRRVAASHNNFYEFLPGKGGPVWKYTGDFEVEPWSVKIAGECHKPQTLDLDDLFAFPHQERLYHFRCVERWAMNVPWSGFPLAELLRRVEPTSKARFVRFVTADRPRQMPGLREQKQYPWPYHEALRMDEAMHDLTLVVTGVYGEPLLKQHGAPIRIIVPWKYGYKSPKSIVRIELVRREPETFWQIQPHEYGFLSNVNPNIPHPRWGQQESYWLDTEERFPTPLFNGYRDQVARLYPDEPTTPQQPLQPGQIAR